MSNIELSEQEQIRRQSMDEMRRMGIEPYPAPEYEVTGYTDEIKANFDDALESPREVAVAGRVMSRRIMGNASFMELMDSRGRIQVYVSRDEICPGEDKDLYNKVFKKLLDIGDFVGIRGYVFRTQTGEITIHARELTVLGKSLRPLPIVKVKDGVVYDSFDDPELRYRRRYVDLVVNEGVKETFIKRTKVFNSMREYFNTAGYLEVETPILQSIPGGAAARPFITHHNALDIELYLRIALELHLKRLIVGGMERVYEIGRVFRNEGIDTRHNPEFTMLESYAAYFDFEDVMDETEGIFKAAASVVSNNNIVNYQGKDVDFDKPFKRVHMVDIIKEYTGVDFWEEMTLEQARALADEHGVHYEQYWKVGHIINEFFEQFCEDKIVDPTFVYGHPVEISPLAKKNVKDPRFTDRFELFILGSEYANAFTELNDPIDQRERFEAQVEERQAGNDEAEGIDEDYIEAMEYGMPPTGGLGIGIDRLVMLLTDAPSIRDVLLFPTMRPIENN